MPMLHDAALRGSMAHASWQQTFDQLNEPPDIGAFLVTDVAGVEIYRGPAETPTQFSGPNATCGTIVIWTGRRP